MAGLLVLLVPAATANHSLYSHTSIGARKGNGPFDPFFRKASADGTKVFFETREQLTNDDTDLSVDVFQRAGGVTTLVSKGQINGNGEIDALFRAVSVDGSRVFFETTERLTSDDTDSSPDIYQRAGGVTTRVSKGQINGNGASFVDFGGISSDGSAVFFTSSERLTDDDHDDRADPFRRVGGVTERLSKSPMPSNGPYDAFFLAAASDGIRALFSTDEKLAPNDFDDGFDIYERVPGATTLITWEGSSTSPAVFVAASADARHVFFLTDESLTANDFDNGKLDVYDAFAGASALVTENTDSNTYDPDFVGASADGTHVFFATPEPVTDDDGDGWFDVFERTGGGVRRVAVATGEPGTADNVSDTSFCGVSSDGSGVFFATGDPLTSDDTNGLWDVYERFGGVTTRISRSSTETGGVGGASCGGNTPDGAHVFFTTDVRLTDEDTDDQRDVYERFAGTTRLVSQGNGPFHASFAGSSAGGDKVFFTTAEPVGATDTDTSHDLYQRSGSTTARLSDGELKGNGPFPAIGVGSSSGGRSFFFTSAEQLTSDDTDASVDLFLRSGTKTARVSAGAINGQGPHNVSFRAASADGTKVFFTTAESLTNDDPDQLSDVYQRSGTTTTLVSRGEPPEFGEFVYDAVFGAASSDGNAAVFTSLEQLTADDSDFNADVFRWSSASPLAVKISQGPFGGNGAFDAAFRGMSANGGTIFLSTPEKLTTDDTDSAVDVYQWSAGVTTRISQGPVGGNGSSNATFAGSSSDGSRAFFTTQEKLTSDDTDGVVDLYQRAGTTTTRLSIGNGAFPVTYVGGSADGTRVFFTTAEKLTADDMDAQVDVYERAGGTTTRSSRGAINGSGAFVATFAAASADGTKVFFTTAEKLTSDDTDAAVDLYRRASGTTTRISQGQVNGNGAFPVSFRRVSSDGLRVFFASDEGLVAADSDTKTDLYERFSGMTYRVSNGNGPYPATYRAASADGTRVFFETAEKLSATDLDGSADVYAASTP